MAVSPAPLRIPGVAELTRRIRETLAETFPAVWVRGEVTGVKRSDRGHLYFSLKEGREAVLECAMYSTAVSRLRIPLKDGLEVEAFGSIDIFAPQGKYQLKVQELRPTGVGALLVALDELKRRLQAEGLFEVGRKRPLPAFPRRIGLVTSPVGAAVQDMARVLRARWPGIGIVLAPVRVQGEGAGLEIADAIRRFGRYGRVDLLIIGRGGGSLEDLWAFNEEIVVRAIIASPIPTISAVGHEADTTLSDFAADRRAATPSNAAEIAVPNRVDVSRRVMVLGDRLRRSTTSRHADLRRRLAEILRRYGFKDPRGAIDLERQRVDRTLERLRDRVRATLLQGRARLEAARRSYGLRDVPRDVARRRDGAVALRERLEGAWSHGRERRRRQVEGCVHRLRALSPRNVMERGYCLVRGLDGTLLRRARDVEAGDPVTIEFARGEADARVEAVREGEPDAVEGA